MQMHMLDLGKEHEVAKCFETEPVTIDNEVRVYTFIEECIQEQLAQYPTTAQVCSYPYLTLLLCTLPHLFVPKEDAALLSISTTTQPISAAALAAITYRLEDKLFLEEIGSVFQEMRKELSCSPASPPLVTELFFDCLAVVNYAARTDGSRSSTEINHGRT